VKKHFRLIFGLILPLTCAGCEEKSRQNLAQCMLAKDAHLSSGGWNVDYLSLCMQAKGFTIDDNLTWGGAKCSDLNFPEIAATCYRSDSWLGKIIARIAN
jgi:hypothetical protein